MSHLEEFEKMFDFVFLIYLFTVFICCLFLISLLFSGSYCDAFIRSDTVPLTLIIGRLCADVRTDWGRLQQIAPLGDK